MALNILITIGIWTFVFSFFFVQLCVINCMAMIVLQVIDETLRLQSIIFMVPRRPKEDIEFKGEVETPIHDSIKENLVT